MHACLFDIDGTLVATGGAGQAAFFATFREDFGISELCQDVPFSGRSDRAIAHDMFAAHAIEPSDENWQRFQAGYLTRLTTFLPMRLGRVLPGVATLIESLARRDDVMVGLLTGNLRAGAERKLSHYELWHHFPFGGFGDDHADRDDIAVAAVQAAEQHLANGAFNGRASGEVAASPSLGRVVVIGDTLNDIRCAKAIGACSVAVPTGEISAQELRTGQPDLLVDTLESTAAILNLFRSNFSAAVR